VLGSAVGHGFVHGDRFTGRRVGEKKLFFDAKSGMVGHGETLIRPVGDLTTGRIRRSVFLLWTSGFEVGGSGLPTRGLDSAKPDF
jgi:hypothetical protein